MPTNRLTTDNDADYPLLGQIIADRYEILEPIGKGGFGCVYKARHLLVKNIVAIKVLRAEYVEDKQIAARFQNEAKIAGRIQNPHITNAFDYGICDKTNVLFIAMEYVPGPSLKDLITGTNELDLETSLHILIQLCDGIAAAHAKDILHRDIKPSNIILTDYDNDSKFVKITDFGISTVLLESEELKRLTNTETANPKGTCLYMAPEQFKAGYKPALPLDIYSIGCVLFELLTGKAPYNGGSDVVTAHLHATADIPALKLDSIEPVIKSRLTDIANKALAKDPSMRYQSAKDLQTDLEKVSGRLNQLQSEKKNKILLFTESAFLFVVGQSKALLSQLYFKRANYSKFAAFFVCLLILLISMLCASSALGTFGSHYDIQYQPALHKAPATLSSENVAMFLLPAKLQLAKNIDDADYVRQSGDLRLALSLYDKADLKADKIQHAHKEMVRIWFGKTICCLFADRPKLAVSSARYCFDEAANDTEGSSQLILAITHAFCGQALYQSNDKNGAGEEFKSFVSIIEKFLQQGDLHASDELAYACGFAGTYYEREGNTDLANLLLERAGDYWKSVGTPGKHNLIKKRCIC